LGLPAFLGEINPVAIFRYQRTQDLENEIDTFLEYYQNLIYIIDNQVKKWTNGENP